MMLWILFGVLCLVAIGFAAWPLYAHEGRMTPVLAIVIVVLVVLPAGLYYQQGSPDLPSAGSSAPEVDDLVQELARRLENNPEDLTGWRMLGRSYLAMRNFSGAIRAFERVLELEPTPSAQTLSSLGEAKLIVAGGNMSMEVTTLFENALAIDPNNLPALYYSGVAAAERNDNALALSRWQRLLNLNVPPEIRPLVEQSVAELAGQVGGNLPTDHPPIDGSAEDTGPAAIFSAQVSVSDAAEAAIDNDAVVFIIARDPAQPIPPIAVQRKMLSELPARIAFSDADSMMEGRSLSQFDEVEVLVRVAVSGQRTQQSGDWIGRASVGTQGSPVIEIEISEQVP
jgi:cytochrome c-type biogenesis protein CcmH